MKNANIKDLTPMPLGRFISEDPILKPGNPNVPFLLPVLLKNPTSLNAYNYVQNNPMLLKDPTGLISTNCPCDHVTCRLVAFPNLYTCYAKVFCNLCGHDIPGLEYLGMYYLTPGGSLSILFECNNFPPPSGPVL